VLSLHSEEKSLKTYFLPIKRTVLFLMRIASQELGLPQGSVFTPSFSLCTSSDFRHSSSASSALLPPKSWSWYQTSLILAATGKFHAVGPQAAVKLSTQAPFTYYLSEWMGTPPETKSWKSSSTPPLPIPPHLSTPFLISEEILYSPLAASLEFCPLYRLGRVVTTASKSTEGIKRFSKFSL